jgi:hypothetical protein
MVDRFFVVGSDSRRPDAERILFCDGTGGGLFRPETDLELSHWRPNRTPAEYRAGTSTEICFRFLDAPRPGPWSAAVNNHLDVDGMLSIYALVHAEHALAHRETLTRAAEMGDFWEWGEPPAQRVFQGLTQLMSQPRPPDADRTKVYEEAFTRIAGLIDGTDPACTAIDESLAPLREGVELVEQGRIARTLVGERCAHYVVPGSVVGDDAARALYVPGFNEAISPQAILWPQARARWDRERVSLVSVDGGGGWYHGLWFPGYLWADTEGRWAVPGMQYRDGMESYDLDHPALFRAFEKLQRQETAPGSWALAHPNFPFHQELLSVFPLVARFTDKEGGWAASQLAPGKVADALKGVFV